MFWVPCSKTLIVKELWKISAPKQVSRAWSADEENEVFPTLARAKSKRAIVLNPVFTWCACTKQWDGGKYSTAIPKVLAIYHKKSVKNNDRNVTKERFLPARAVSI